MRSDRLPVVLKLMSYSGGQLIKKSAKIPKQERSDGDNKESDMVGACSAGDLGSIPGSGRCPGEGNGNPFQYSCLGYPMDRGA